MKKNVSGINLKYDFDTHECEKTLMIVKKILVNVETTLFFLFFFFFKGVSNLILNGPLAEAI
jgi:hypothetical protein